MPPEENPVIEVNGSTKEINPTDNQSGGGESSQRQPIRSEACGPGDPGEFLN